MKNGSITNQLNMQERQISDERKMNECSQVGIYADKQENISENLIENKQENKNENTQNSNQENNQSINLPNISLSSVLGLFTPDIGNAEDEQIPKKKK